MDISNCFFYEKRILDFKPPYEFDIILSLAVHRDGKLEFERLVEKVYKRMLKEGGYLLFESRNFGEGISFGKFVNYLKSVGFAEKWNGICQCSTNYGNKKNQRREFCVFKLLDK